MKIEPLKAFMAALGVFNVNYAGGGWAQSSCPLAPWTHKSGKDANPSFGVSVGDGPSHFNCFVCSSGSLAELVQTIEMHLPTSSSLVRMRYKTVKAREILDASESDMAMLPDYEELVPSPYTQFQEWPEYWLQTFPKWDDLFEPREYVLHERKLNQDTADAFDLRYDVDRSMLVAPIRDVEGRLCGARGRRIAGEGLKHFDYAWNNVRNSHLVWFNEMALDLLGPLVIVEGQFDAMRVWPHHPKVMAILSAKTTPYKMAKLTAMDQVVLMLDNDETGKQKTGEWAEYLQRKGVQVGIIELPEGVKDAGEAPEAWLHSTFSDLTN